MIRFFMLHFMPRGRRQVLQELNTAVNDWSRESDRLDFRAEDHAPDQLLNQILWVAAKGEQVPYPAPVHAAFVEAVAKADKDDD
jgi:hypothetical protein